MSDATIVEIHPWEALDSRGRPTVAVGVRLAGGAAGRVVVPSGASTGAHEAIERRDGDARYGGYGVTAAVRAVSEELAPAVVGRSALDSAGIDAALERVDGTPGLGRVGSNAVLAVSLGVAVASSQASGHALWEVLDPGGQPLLPMPMINILSGGAHAGGAIDLQDVLVVPLGAGSFSEALHWVWQVRAATATLLEEAGGWSALVADEGGLSARLGSNERALQLVTRGIEAAGFDAGGEVALAIDVAASQLTKDAMVVLAEAPQPLHPLEWLEQIAAWSGRYPLCSVEDPVGEDDWSAWASARRLLGGTQLLGDDLFATNLERLERGIADDVANAVLVKVNQAGTLSRAAAVARRAEQAGLARVVSARSGDTEDHWLADLAVGWRAGQIKVGSTMRSERTAKWNRLLEIESEGNAEFAGRRALATS